MDVSESIIYRHARVSVAPMMGYTDRHFRVLMRLLAPRSLIYTQMMKDEAVIRLQDRSVLFGEDRSLKGVDLQLGSASPERLALAVAIAEPYEYEAINLNVGCPSSKVQLANMGACLFKQPKRVAQCVEAMRRATNRPITVKMRIGVDECDRFEDAVHFIQTVHEAGCNDFIVHARKAWLKGLSPAQNRSIPKLDYHRVLALKSHFPKINFVLNGGIVSYEQAMLWLGSFNQVMIGRQAPRQLQLIAQLALGSSEPIECQPVLKKYFEYIERNTDSNRFHHMLKHCVGVYQGQPNASFWRKAVSNVMQNNNLSCLQDLLHLSGQMDQSIGAI